MTPLYIDLSIPGLGEMLGQPCCPVDRRLAAHPVLDQSHPLHRGPLLIVTDNGTKFTSNAMFRWSQTIEPEFDKADSGAGTLANPITAGI